jgi:hypothetical protein
MFPVTTSSQILSRISLGRVRSLDADCRSQACLWVSISAALMALAFAVARGSIVSSLYLNMINHGKSKVLLCDASRIGLNVCQGNPTSHLQGMNTKRIAQTLGKDLCL